MKGRDGGKGMDRRRFVIGGCAACMAGGMAAAPGLARAAGKQKIRVIYALYALKQDRPDWPNLGFDFAPVMDQYNHALRAGHPEVEFLPATAKNLAQAGRIALSDLLAGIDGFIIFQMNNQAIVAEPLVDTGKPVLHVDFLYGGTGGFLVNSALQARVLRKNFGFVSSLNFDDVVAAVGCFKEVRDQPGLSFAEAVSRSRRSRTPGPGDLSVLDDPLPAVSTADALAKLKASKILAVGYPGVSILGLPQVGVDKVGYEVVDRYMQGADRDQAAEVAAGWRRRAAVIEGVSDATLADSARMYLGMKKLMAERGANAITINCLTGFYSGILKAYPCLGFFELCNEGQVGACECDVRSAASMLAVNAISGGRPGYISDPAIDTSARRIIYAHCVASNKPFGPDGAENPFEVLTHSEDRKGASVRSLMPAGFMTTTVEFGAEARAVLIHRAKATGHDPNDRACRTKLVAEPVGDIEKLFTAWDRWGWHRVTVYGDLRERVGALADAIGYKVVEEA